MWRLSRKCSSRVLLTAVLISACSLFASHSLQWSYPVEQQGQRQVFGRPRSSNNNIFFFETSCTYNQSWSRDLAGLALDVRQACALESTARANPDMNIFLFSTCHFDEHTITRSSEMVQQIFERHDNLYVWHQSLESLFKHSPLQQFFNSGRMFDTPFKKVQSSNVGRVLLLKKFGGTYLDLDFIVQRSLSGLASNFAGIESSKAINGAALRFSLDATGRRVADMFIQEINNTFNGKIWGRNGPGLTTRVLKKLCKFTKVVPLTANQCSGFTVYGGGRFYPVHYLQWKHLYEEDWTDKILKMTESSTAVHLWNSMVRYQKIPKIPDQFRDSNQPIMVLQRKYCPIAHSFNNVLTVQ